MRRRGAALEGHSIASAAQSLDRLKRSFGIELPAQPADEYLDYIAVALEILVVEGFRDLRFRQDLTGVDHEVLEQPVFEGRELERLTVDGYDLAARIERNRPADELRLRPTACAAQQRIDPSESSSTWNGLTT